MKEISFERFLRRVGGFDADCPAGFGKVRLQISTTLSETTLHLKFDMKVNLAAVETIVTSV